MMQTYQLLSHFDNAHDAANASCAYIATIKTLAQLFGQQDPLAMASLLLAVVHQADPLDDEAPVVAAALRLARVTAEDLDMSGQGGPTESKRVDAALEDLTNTIASMKKGAEA